MAVVLALVLGAGLALGVVGPGREHGDGGRAGPAAVGVDELLSAPAYQSAVARAEALVREREQERNEQRNQDRVLAYDPAGPAPDPPEPRGYGDDAGLDELWRHCEQGHGAACDELFQLAPLGSDYEAFGLSCGNRPDVLHCRDLDGD